MIDVIDRREQFKRDCKSKNYWLKCIDECNLKLEELSVKLQGVSSPRIEKVKCENASHYDNRFELMMEEEQVLNERERYKTLINQVDNQMRNIVSSVDREIVKELYVEKKLTQEQIAEKYHYATRITLIKHINRVIEKYCC